MWPCRESLIFTQNTFHCLRVSPTNYGEVFRLLPTPVLLVATGNDPIFSANRKQKVYSNFLNSLFLTKGEATPWSGWRITISHHQFGKLIYFLYTTSAYGRGNQIRTGMPKHRFWVCCVDRFHHTPIFSKLTILSSTNQFPVPFDSYGDDPYLACSILVSLPVQVTLLRKKFGLISALQY